MVYYFFKKNILAILITILASFFTLFTTGCGNSGCRTIEEQYYGGEWEQSDDVKVKPINNNMIEQENSIGSYILRNGTTEALAKEHRWYKMRNNRGDDLIVKAGQLVQLNARGNIILTGFSQTINLTMNDWIGLNGSNYTTAGGVWYTKTIPENTKPTKMQISVTHNRDGSLKKKIIYSVKNSDGVYVDIPVNEGEEVAKINIENQKQAVGILSNLSNCVFDDNGQITSCDQYKIVTTENCTKGIKTEDINYMWFYVKQIRFKKWIDENRNIIDKEVIIDEPYCSIEGDTRNGIWYVCDFEYEGENFQYKRKNRDSSTGLYPSFEEQVISKTHEIKVIGGFSNTPASTDNGCSDYTSSSCIHKIQTNADNAKANSVETDAESVRKHFVMCIAGGKNDERDSDNDCTSFVRNSEESYNHIVIVNKISPIEVVFKTGSEIGLTKTTTLSKGQKGSKYCRYLPKTITYSLHKYKKNFGWDDTTEFCREECKDLCGTYFFLQSNPTHVTCTGDDCHFKINNAIDLTSSRDTVDFNEIHSEYRNIPLTQVFELTQNNNETHRANIANVCLKKASDTYGEGWYGFYARKLKQQTLDDGVFYTNQNQNFTIIAYDYYEKEKTEVLSLVSTHAANHNGDPNWVCYHCCTCKNYNCIYVGDYNDELQQQIREAAAVEAAQNTASGNWSSYSHNCFTSRGSRVSTNTRPKLFNYTPFQDVKYDVNKFEGKTIFGVDQNKCPGNCPKINYIDDGICNECNVYGFQETVLSTDYRQSLIQNMDPRKGGQKYNDRDNTMNYKINDGETYEISGYDELVNGYLPILSPEIDSIECYDEDLPIDEGDLFTEYFSYQDKENFEQIPEGCTLSGSYQEYNVSSKLEFNTDTAGLFPIKWAGYTIKSGYQLPITISSTNPALIRKSNVTDINSTKDEDYMELKNGNGLMVYISSADDEPNSAKYANPEAWQCNLGLGGSYGYYRPYNYSDEALKSINNPRQIDTPNGLWWICDDPVPMWFTGYDYVNVKTGNPVNMHVFETEEIKRMLPNYTPPEAVQDETVETLGCNENHIPTSIVIEGQTYTSENIQIVYDNTEGAMYKYRASSNDDYKTINIDDQKINTKEYSPFSPKIIQVTFTDNNDKNKVYENVSIKAVEYKVDEGGNETSEVKNLFNELTRTYDTINGRIVQAYYEFNYSDGHHKIKLEDKNVVGDASCYFVLKDLKREVSAQSLATLSDYQFKDNDDYYVLNDKKIFTRFGPFTGMQEETSGILLPAIYTTYGMCRGKSDNREEFIYDTQAIKTTFYGIGFTDRKKLDHWFRLEFTTPDVEDNGNSGIKSRCVDTARSWEPCSSVNLNIPDILVVDLAKTNNALLNHNSTLSGNVILYKDYNNISISKKKYYIITHKDQICDIDWSNYILDKDDTRINKIEKDGRINVDDNETGIRIHLTIDGKDCVLDDNEDGTTISTVQERYIFSFIYKDMILSIEKDNVSFDVDGAICFAKTTQCSGYLGNYRTAGRFELLDTHYRYEDSYESYALWLFDKCYNDYGAAGDNNRSLLNCINNKSGINNYSTSSFSTYCSSYNSEEQNGEVQITATVQNYNIKKYSYLFYYDVNDGILTNKELTQMCSNSRKYGFSKKDCMSFIEHNAQACHINKKIRVIDNMNHIYNMDALPYIISCASDAHEKNREFKLPYSTKFMSDNETNFTNKRDGLIMKSNIPTLINNQYFARCVADWHTPKWMLMERPGDPTSFYHGFDLLSGAYITDNNSFTKESITKQYSALWASYGGMVTNAIFNVTSTNKQLSDDVELKGNFKKESVVPFNAEFTAKYPKQFILVKPIINDPINTSDDYCTITANINNGDKGVAFSSFSMNEPFNSSYSTSNLRTQKTSKSNMKDREVAYTETDEDIRLNYKKYYIHDNSYETVNGKNSEKGNFFKDSEMVRNWIGAGILRPYWHTLKDSTGKTHIFNQNEKISFDTQGYFYGSGNLSLQDKAFCMNPNSLAEVVAVGSYTTALALEVSSFLNFAFAAAYLITHSSVLWQGWPGSVAATVAGVGAGLQGAAIAMMEAGNEANKTLDGGSYERGYITSEKPEYAQRKCGVGAAFRVIPVPPFACLTEYKYHCSNDRIDQKVASSSTSEAIDDLCISTAVPSWQSATEIVGTCKKQEIRIEDNVIVVNTPQRYLNQDKKINSLIDAPPGASAWDPLENIFQTQCGICAKTSSIYTYNGIHYYIDSEDPKELMEEPGMYSAEHCGSYTNSEGDTYSFYKDITYMKPISSYTSKQKINIQNAILNPLKNKLEACDKSYVLNVNLNNDKYTKMWQNAFLKAQIRNSSSSISQLLAIYSSIISETSTTQECKELVLDQAEDLSNVAYNSILSIIKDVSGDVYYNYVFEQNMLSASCADDKKGQGGLGLTPDVSNITSYKSITRSDQSTILSNEGYGELLTEFAVSSGDNSLTLNIPKKLNGKEFKKAKIGFTFAGVNNIDPMYLYKDYRRLTQEDLDRGYTITIGSTAQVANGKYLYFFIQPLNDSGLPDESYNPNVIFSPSKTEYSNDYYVAKDDMVYSFKDYDPDDDGEITFSSPRTGKLWLTILDSEELAGTDADADGKMIEFTTDENDLRVDDSNVVATNAGYYLVKANVQKETLESLTGDDSGSGLNTLITNLVVKNIKKIFLGDYKCVDKNGRSVCNYQWEDGILGQVALSFFKIHLLYIAWFLLVIFTVVILSFQILLGQKKFDFKFMKDYLIRYALIMTFVNPNSLELYCRLFVNTAFNLSEGLSAYVAGAFNTGKYEVNNPSTFANVAFGPVDQILKFWINKYTLEKMLAIIFSSWPGIIVFVILILCFVLFLINVIEAVILYVVILIKMSLYLSVGPIVFLLLIHEKTASKFTDWWKVIAGCIAEQVCMFAALSFFANVYYHILKGSMNFIYCWEPVLKIPILNITIFSMWRISGTMPAHMAELSGTLGDETSVNTKGFNILTAFMLFILTCMMSKFVSKASTFGAGLFDQESSMPDEVKQALDGIKGFIADAPKKAKEMISAATKAKKGAGEDGADEGTENRK